MSGREGALASAPRRERLHAQYADLLATSAAQKAETEAKDDEDEDDEDDDDDDDDDDYDY